MDEMQRLRAAYDHVKEGPEFLPDERVCWLDLRAAAEKVPERFG